MKKILFPILVLAFVLTSCGGVKATVSNNAYAKESQALVDKWVAAYHSRDSATLLSLYSDDVVYSFCGTTDCSRYGLTELKAYLPIDLSEKTIKIAWDSYFLTQLGERAVVQGHYTNPNKPVDNAQTVVILEIKNGKITHETWYWAGA